MLALGTSGLREQFTIHSYEGPAGGFRPPEHPEHGLRPHEADDLVDQLGALTEVECGELDPLNGAAFYPWLRGELVRMVGELPKATMDLARELGLPDNVRLAEILTRHTLSRRRPVLLHGDLNPWNLVRRPDGGLTLIDWEMAMVGDPLYDLVRHMHLTPTRPEIRDRMFRRWERRLPPDCARDWRDDWRVYRWIETVRSAYVDLHRLVTGAGLEAPNVQRAVQAYAMTLAEATAALGLPDKSTANPHLAPRCRTEPAGATGGPGPGGRLSRHRGRRTRRRVVAWWRPACVSARGSGRSSRCRTSPSASSWRRGSTRCRSPRWPPRRGVQADALPVLPGEGGPRPAPHRRPRGRGGTGGGGGAGAARRAAPALPRGAGAVRPGDRAQ